MSRYTPKNPTNCHAVTTKLSTPRMYETRFGVVTVMIDGDAKHSTPVTSEMMRNWARMQ